MGLRQAPPPADRRDVSFVWGGDVAGQGWGINPDDGGMFTFATMRKYDPDLFIHSGDTIYADGPIAAEQAIPNGGGMWKNLTTEAKSKIAETLDDYVAIAVRLARDSAWRMSVKERIAANKKRLYHDRAPVEALERFLTQAVRGASA